MTRNASYEPARPPRLLTTDEAAEVLAITASAVKAWRVRGGGPRYIKVGQQVRYRLSDLLDWLDARTVDQT